MSVLSTQVDELRELATKFDEIQSGATRAVRVSLDMGSILREAADTICELRNRCTDLVDEREEYVWTREFMDRMAKHCGTKDCPSLVAYVEGLEAENAKLRERITTQKQTIQAYRDESRDWREVAERAQAENAKLRKLAKDLHTLAYSVLPERKSDYITICSVESCIDYYSRTMPSIERRMRELGVEL